MKYLYFLPLALVFAVISAPLDAEAQLPVGTEAPDWTFLDQNDVPHTMSDYAGKVVLLYCATTT